MSKGRWGKRRLNKLSWTRNHLGEYYLFGFVGTGKDETVVTLAYRKTREGIISIKNKYVKYIGELMNDVPRDRSA